MILLAKRDEAEKIPLALVNNQPVQTECLNDEQERIVHEGLLTLFWQYRHNPDKQIKINEILERCLATK